MKQVFVKLLYLSPFLEYTGVYIPVQRHCILSIVLLNLRWELSQLSGTETQLLTTYTFKHPNEFKKKKTNKQTPICEEMNTISSNMTCFLTFYTRSIIFHVVIVR